LVTRWRVIFCKKWFLRQKLESASQIFLPKSFVANASAAETVLRSEMMICIRNKIFDQKNPPVWDFECYVGVSEYFKFLEKVGCIIFFSLAGYQVKLFTYFFRSQSYGWLLHICSSDRFCFEE
jgi:hypothetical protein